MTLPNIHYFMFFLKALAGSLILSLYMSEMSCAYDDPTQPSTSEPSSNQPSIGNIQTERNSSKRSSDKYPCIEDVCIGDDIRDLSNINWEPTDKTAFNSPAAKAINLRAIGNPADIKAFTPYWFVGRLDNKGVKILSKIKAFCEITHGLRGIYIDKYKRKVFVTFLQRLSDDEKSQALVVYAISQSQFIPGGVNQYEYADLQSQVKQKYPRYDGNNPSEARVVANTSSTVTNTTVTLYLWAPTTGVKAIALPRMNGILNFPGCPTDSKIKI
jgi:hypothetical protein